MADQMPATLPGPAAYQTTARVVGVVYILGFVVGIGGERLIQSLLGAPDALSAISANSTRLAIGALLWLIAVAGDAAHGILMFPVLKPHSERIAVGYFGTRVVEAVFVAVMALFVLVQIPLGSEYARPGAPEMAALHTLSTLLTEAQRSAYQFGMIALSVSGVLLCDLFSRARLVPRLVALWGLIGYAILLGGSVLAVAGLDLGLLHTIPGGLWELFIGGWLIAKGFGASPTTIVRPPLGGIASRASRRATGDAVMATAAPDPSFR